MSTWAPAPPHHDAPDAAPAYGRRSRWPLLLFVVGSLVAAVAIGAMLLSTHPTWNPWAGSADAATTTPSASPAAPVDPLAALQSQHEADRPAAEATAGSWVPQVSSKKVGMVVDGKTYDAAAVLADHRALRARYPQALLVWSGDYTSFRGDDFWITVVAAPTAAPTSASANAWCDDAGLGADQCYAKRLSHSGGYAGNTAMRTGTASSVAVPSAVAAEPTLGAAYAPDLKGFGGVRPGEINANGDGTSYVDGVSWSSWGGPTARGTGTASWVPPTGFVSDGVQTAAVVVASDLGDCHGKPAYRRVGWYFPSKGETGVGPEDGYADICNGP